MPPQTVSSAQSVSSAHTAQLLHSKNSARNYTAISDQLLHCKLLNCYTAISAQLLHCTIPVSPDKRRYRAPPKNAVTAETRLPSPSPSVPTMCK
jgi:hypothetical protein